LDLTEFENELRSVDAMLTDIETGKSALGQFVMGDQLYNDLNRRVAEIDHGVRAAASTTSDVGKALYRVEGYNQIRDPILRFDQILAEMQAGRSAYGPLLQDTAQYESLRKQVAQIQQAIADLHAGSLLSSDEMYAGLARNVAGWIQSIDEF